MRAIQIVTKAVEEDEKKNYKDAYHLYCEGLQYFVPLIRAEADPAKREHLQRQATNYMQRAEEIKRSARQAYILQRQNSASSSVAEANAPTAEAISQPVEPVARATTTENTVLAAINPSSNFKHMCKFKSTHLQGTEILFEFPFQTHCSHPRQRFSMPWI